MSMWDVLGVPIFAVPSGKGFYLSDQLHASITLHTRAVAYVRVTNE